jgi:uncharacterized protein YuzE
MAALSGHAVAGEAEQLTVPSGELQTMKIQYFQDTDTLYIELRPSLVTGTRDLDENTLIELDDGGGLCAITVEHAGERVEWPSFSFERIAA